MNGSPRWLVSIRDNRITLVGGGYFLEPVFSKLNNSAKSAIMKHQRGEGMGYSTDLTDKQWVIIEPIFKSNKGKNLTKHSKRTLVNAVLYLVKTGCQWRLLPNDFPSHDTVWSFYRRAVQSGKWEKAMDLLVKKNRIRTGRKSVPTYGIIDSQSAKTVLASEERGIDGGKKIKGRKRHIVVDTQGYLLAIVVHAANIHDTKSGINPAKQAFEKYPSIQKFCGDDGYRKSFEQDVLEQLGLGVDISKRIKPKFEILPKRWVVERTFGWATHSRRLFKDVEIKTVHEENMFMISHLTTLLKRY